MFIVKLPKGRFLIKNGHTTVHFERASKFETYEAAQKISPEDGEIVAVATVQLNDREEVYREVWVKAKQGDATCAGLTKGRSPPRSLKRIADRAERFLEEMNDPHRLISSVYLRRQGEDLVAGFEASLLQYEQTYRVDLGSVPNNATLIEFNVGHPYDAACDEIEARKKPRHNED